MTARLWSRVEKTETCWIWTGATNGRGYGALRVGGRGVPLKLAHRLAYELEVGPIPEGLTIDHLCRVKTCVNPDHLEVVTRAENTIRAHRRDACRRGHPWTEESTEWRDGRTRSCRICRRASQQRKAAA